MEKKLAVACVVVNSSKILLILTVIKVDIKEHLFKLDIVKLANADNLHPRVFKELAQQFSRSIILIFCKLY